MQMCEKKTTKERQKLNWENNQNFLSAVIWPELQTVCQKHHFDDDRCFTDLD